VNFADYRGRPTQPYQIEGDKIATKFDSPLDFKYIARITDTSKYDSTFVVALAARLALEACETLTQSNQKLQNLGKMYDAAISEARQNDAIQNPPEPLPDDTWVLSRR